MRIALMILFVLACQSCSIQSRDALALKPPILDESVTDFKTYTAFPGADFWPKGSQVNSGGVVEKDKTALNKEDYLDLIDVAITISAFLGLCHWLYSNSDNTFNPHDSSGGHSYHLLYDAMFCLSDRHEAIE